MALAYWYANALTAAFGSTGAGGAPNIDYLSDNLYCALVTNAYTPDAGAHDFWDDVVANEISGTGYTTNGALLASKTLTITAANSWATQWAGTTTYTAGQIVRPTVANGYVYRCITAGTSGGSQPTWPTTVGLTVTDGGVVWQCAGRVVIQFDAADVSWANSTLTARYAVIYDRTPATDATRPLLCYIDFQADKSTEVGTFAITFDALGLLVATV